MRRNKKGAMRRFCFVLFFFFIKKMGSSRFLERLRGFGREGFEKHNRKETCIERSRRHHVVTSFSSLRRLPTRTN